MIRYVTEIQSADDRVYLLLHRINDRESCTDKQTHVVANQPNTESGILETCALASILQEAFHEIEMQAMREAYERIGGIIDGAAT